MHPLLHLISCSGDYLSHSRYIMPNNWLTVWQSVPTLNCLYNTSLIYMYWSYHPIYTHKCECSTCCVDHLQSPPWSMSLVHTYHIWGNTNFYGISLTFCFTKWDDELNSIFKEAETNWCTGTKLLIKVTTMVLSQSLEFKNSMQGDTTMWKKLTYTSQIIMLGLTVAQEVFFRHTVNTAFHGLRRSWVYSGW